MVNQKKPSLRALAKSRQSGKERKLTGSSKVAKPSGKGKAIRTQAVNAPTERRVLRVGDKIPLETLEVKVLLDDGKKTSLGEQLEKSRPGGLIVFLYPKADDDAYDYATEFDYRQFNYELADISMIGLTPHSVSANATLKEAKELYFPLLSDPKSKLINAMNFNILKGSKHVGVFVIDKERNLQVHSFGKKDSVLDQLDRGMDAIMEKSEDS